MAQAVARRSIREGERQGVGGHGGWHVNCLQLVACLPNCPCLPTAPCPQPSTQPCPCTRLQTPYWDKPRLGAEPEEVASGIRDKGTADKLAAAARRRREKLAAQQREQQQQPGADLE